MASILGGLGLLLAACSSGAANASGSNSTTTTARGAGGSASFAAYTSCLKSHGVNFAGGFFGGRGQGGPPSSGTTRPTISATERSALTKAESACASLRPTGGFGGGANNAAFAAYRNCLKLHGVTLPTGRGAGGFPGSGTSTSTTSDPKTKAALAACAALRPKGGFGGPRSTTTTTS
jgi:hypothetical protein